MFVDRARDIPLVKIDSTFKTDHFPVVMKLPSVDENRDNDVILKSVSAIAPTSLTQTLC